MMTEHIEKTVYLYGRWYEKRQRAGADSAEYAECDAVCMALYRELRSLGAIDIDGNMHEIYTEDFTRGQDSVSEY